MKPVTHPAHLLLIMTVLSDSNPPHPPHTHTRSTRVHRIISFELSLIQVQGFPHDTSTLSSHITHIKMFSFLGGLCLFVFLLIILALLIIVILDLLLRYKRKVVPAPTKSIQVSGVSCMFHLILYVCFHVSH